MYFFIIISIFMRSRLSYGITTNCLVPSVGKGHKTNLTCYFSTDIGKTSNTVKIVRYTYTSDSVQDTTVFLCHLSSKPLKCRTYSGYAFEGNITDKLTLVIPHADEEHIASYECHVFYSEKGSDRPCAFTLNGISTNCSVPLVGKGQKTNLTCHFSADLRIINNTVKIIRYIDTANGLQDTTVLVCHVSAKHRKCQAKAEYIFEGTITDKLSLEIPHADEEHIGTYKCHVLNSDSEDNSCKFELKDYGPKTTLPVSVTEKTDSPVNNGTNIIAILVGAVGSLLVFIVVVPGLIFALYYKRTKQCLILKHQRNRRKP